MVSQSSRSTVETIRVPKHSLRSGHAIRVEGGPYGVCLVRIGEHFYAVSDRCSHANVSLSEGEVDPEECLIECWKHGSSFSLETGEPQSLPATEAVPVYEVSIDGDDVVVIVR